MITLVPAPRQHRAGYERMFQGNSLLLKAHVVDMGVSLVHNLLLQQLLYDVLNSDDAHRRRALLSTESCCARYTALRCLQGIIGVSHNA